MRPAIVAAALLLASGCAVRYVRTTTGTRYISAHFAQREAVATIEAATADGANLRVDGYARRPDEATAKAIAAGAVEALK